MKSLAGRLEPIPIVSATEVVVAGGGPAGVCAAVSAARAGARVALLENRGCLGGVWTAGFVSWIIDYENKSGIVREIVDRVTAYGGSGTIGSGFGFDPEVMKVILEEICEESGVRVRLHTRVSGAVVENGELRAAITESKSGSEAWEAAVFIDATGDGDLAAFAGARFDMGEEETGACQPMSLLALLSGVPYAEARPFVTGRTGDEDYNFAETKARFLAEFRRAGVDPSYAKPTLFHLGNDLYSLMSNHEYGRSAINADDITTATLRARREIFAQVRALKSLGGIWDGLRLVSTADQIGVREGRRLRGLYRVTKDDLLSGSRHPDSVCRVTFHVDVHSPDTSRYGSGISDAHRIKSSPYDIPLRALVSADVEGLLFAGRCISGDFFAHASYRVTGNAAALGEAAGKAAAAAARSDVSPAELARRVFTGSVILEA